MNVSSLWYSPDYMLVSASFSKSHDAYAAFTTAVVLRLVAKSPELVLLAVSVYLLRPVYRFFFSPFDYKVTRQVKNEIHGIDANDIGVTAMGIQAVNRLRKQVGKIPPAYPRYAWFTLCFAHDLPHPGSMLRVNVLGKNLLVFRGSSDPSKVYTMDAYCPHLGADLGGGKVVKVVKECEDGSKVTKDCIECPFHKWAFSGEGECEHIPYEEKIPRGANVKTYLTYEANDMIYMWNDTETQPAWYPMSFEVMDRKEMTYHGHSEHYITAHIQELPENGADLQHIFQLHGPMMGAFINSWNATWEPQPAPDEHNFKMEVVHTIGFNHNGKTYTIPFIPHSVSHTTQNGPGQTYHEFDFLGGLWKIMVVATVTPMAPLLQRATFAVYGSRWAPRWFCKFILSAFLEQVERDIPIWNHKKYEHHPILGKSEGTILKYRRWFRQFYSEEDLAENGDSALTANNGLEW
ncbi:hypothetical protein BZG36_04279 [Bifiguratus adelaidae]|uniref:cholesterol 7-desaturase n=1 Tax=Bifiguratus adelaidae TaxID=1938954 RepID=A0A261XW44_9FUNG|nr:hypothetical protein BZG36_04279 [Bifiguratus adelaidae]